VDPLRGLHERLCFGDDLLVLAHEVGQDAGLRRERRRREREDRGHDDEQQREAQ
jgi:hypothetical protein